MTSNLIYIASPYAGEVEKNIAFAKAACRYAMAEGHTPVAVHLLYPQLLDDNDPAQRASGLTMGHRVLAACDELWVCGECISTGMVLEITEAEKLGIPIREVSAEQIQGGFQMEQKYAVWAVRSAASVCGAAQSWCKHGGRPMEFETMAQAAEYADQLNKNCYTPNVSYYPKEMEPVLAQSHGFSQRM